MATETASRLQATAQAYRDRLERQTVDASNDMARAWVTAQQRIALEAQALLSKIEAARLAGVTPSPAWLYQERRLTGLLATVQAEAARWAATAEPAIRELAYQAAADASRAARELATEAALADLPGVDAAFTDLNPENMASILGHLAPGGPLRDLLVSIGAETAHAASEALLTGVILGKGSDWIGRQLQQALDIPRWRADTIARTEALRAFRETSRETYKRSNVVGEWEWTAALDRRTCPACVALHGSRFSLDEHLDGHPRCRCAMVPVTKTWAELGLDPALDEQYPRARTETGPEWLKRQSPLTQRAVLGPGKFRLYSEGKADLGDFVARTHSPEWGTMRRERSLKELAEGRNPDYRDTLPEQSEDDLWEAMVREEADRAAALTPPRWHASQEDWDRWETGRDVEVRGGAPADRTFAQSDVAYYREAAARDAAQVEDFKALVKARQAELRAFVPDAKERAKVSRTDYTLKSRKESLASVQKMADQSAALLREAEEKLRRLTPTRLPDWDPDNPLAFYGNRVHFHDRSPSAVRHARDLEEHISAEDHRALRDYFADSDHGGIYMGDSNVLGLDRLRDELDGQAPRGYAEGSTFGDCYGVCSHSSRVVGVGHAAHGLDARHSTALHEAGHALDAAYGFDSRSTAWGNILDSVPADTRREWNPYYRPDGNPNGYASETWAEAFQAWTKVRALSREEQAKELARSLIGTDTPSPRQWEPLLPMADHLASIRRIQ